jgi:transcriptional regulator with XRE-family HTH domain
MTADSRLAAGAGVGPLLKAWRRQRRLSQLELAIAADVSARHVSFVETGRSRPSAAMILRLAERLDVPIRDRNALLVAAGYAPAFPETPLAAPGMAPLREVLDRLLRGYEPYPALVFDASYDVVTANRAVAALLAGVAEHLLEPPMNVLRLALHPKGIAPRIVNYGQVRRYLLDRLTRHLSTWQSDRLRALSEEIHGYPAPDGVAAPADSGAGGPDGGSAAEAEAGAEMAFAVPLRLRHGDGELSFVSTVATFNTPLDVTVSELAIETFLPADSQTATALHAG